ncbi:MAG: hypothetical protein ABII72_04985, partial [Parcubacteria group bacterium]
MLGGILVVILILFVAAPFTSASQTDQIQPADAITYNEDLIVNGTVEVNSIHVGQEGTGGVTYFNGSVLNAGATTPFTIADDVRIDGGIWRGPSKGTSDDMPLKIYDTMVPGVNNVNDLGSASLKWKNLYLTGTVTTSGLQGTGIVSSSNLADNAVTGGKIADGTIVAEDIAGSAITGAKIADGAVTSAKIENGAIATADIADGAITSAKISNGTIIAGDMADDAITEAKIADDAITEAKIADDAITEAKIADDNVTASKINGTGGANLPIAYGV